VKQLSSLAVFLSLVSQLLSITAAAQVKTPGSPATGSPQGGTGTAPGPIGPPGAAPTPIVNASPNYVVGPNDRIRITVWNQEDVSGEYVVSADGSFTFPLIGRVMAAGRTLAKLETELKQLLAAGFFRDPQVTAAVVDFRSKQIFIMGSVRQPGAVALTGEMTLIEALARVGSTTPEAADYVFILHSSNAHGPILPGQDDSATTKRVDLRELNAGQLPASVVVQDGDTVYVPAKQNVYVSGQVRNPGAYPVGQEMTVRQVLSLAGGPSEFGAVNRVKILRKENGKEIEIKAEQTDLVKPGDTVVVPERFF
jgi:polysaccharide biosynthesis/export protein